MARFSRAASEAAAAFQAPLKPPPKPPEKRRRHGGETVAHISSGDSTNSTTTQCEKQDRLGRAFAGVAGQLANLRRTDDPVARVDAAAHVLREALGPGERGWLLMVAAQAAEPDNLEALATRVVESGFRGQPPPVFDDMRAEAVLWASWASPHELIEYFGAIWHRLPERERKGFLKAAKRKVAA